MGDVEVPAVYHGLYTIEFLHVLKEISFELLPVSESRELPLGIRYVHAYEIELLEFKGYHPSLMVMLIYTYSV